MSAAAFVSNVRGEPAMALADAWRGSSCFLCCCGPSLATTPLELLNQRGLLTAAVNQAGATIPVRPNFWFAYDSPGRFHERIWCDPGIMKFVRAVHQNLNTRRFDASGNRWVSSRPVQDFPNVWFVDNGFGFTPEAFLGLAPPAFGGKFVQPDGHTRETKSVFLVAVRLLYWLGIREIYLVGADWHCRPEEPYGFAIAKSRGACGANNTTLEIVRQWMHAMRPHFEAAGLNVWNCTPGSKLDTFDFLDFTEAVNREVAKLPVIDTLRGIYQGC